MADYYIGVMSGTSMDAVDAVIVDFSTHPPQLLASHSREVSTPLREELLELAQPGNNEIDRMALLDRQIGNLIAELCNELITTTDINREQIAAIGSHGQTIRHAPDSTPSYTVQIGDPNTIAQLTGLSTVADFRRRDMVVGGQGAPLVPAFHQALFQCDEKNRVVMNIGGIANITVLPAGASGQVFGFDTGPGNMLMDAWIQHHLNQPYDTDGDWASSGAIEPELLGHLLRDPYLGKPPPKSTGREHYSLKWLEPHLQKEYALEDVQATLCEFTAISATSAIRQFAPQTEEIFVCGGGTRNSYLMERITHNLVGCRFNTTAELGVDPQWVEAMAFAWLARQTLLHLPGNLPAVTGASQSVILGAIYPAP
ncbi:MAG: anhydro-N-acetylmuramic acid kinase [Chromatiales bacterium]|nr:anhydro-N-acetylmuramic acid kinase [Chromatiales bacterium]